MRLQSSMPTSETVAPDALLVHRVAALSDKTALAELDARYGLTLYALAYSFLFDGEAADVAVAAVLREVWRDRKSTRLNSSHGYISYAVFCLKKKKKQIKQ